MERCFLAAVTIATMPDFRASGECRGLLEAGKQGSPEAESSI